MNRIFVGMLCCLFSACVVPVEDSDPIEDAAVTSTTEHDYWKHKAPTWADPCTYTYDAHGVKVPVLCAPYWFDKGDPPPDRQGIEEITDPGNESPLPDTKINMTIH